MEGEGIVLYKEAAKSIVSRIQDIHRSLKTEEDVRIRCENIFLQELRDIGIAYNPSYEAQVSAGAIDALFNQLCIEYKKPHELTRRFDFHVEEKSKYINSLAIKFKIAEEQIVCVIIDGFSIGFFRMNREGVLIKSGPYSINEKSISHFIALAHATQAKALISENLLRDFGFNSYAMKQLSSALFNALISRNDPRTEMFFKEWCRLFGQISGINEGNQSLFNDLEYLGLPLPNDSLNYSQYVFILHTTYAIYIKHIALMILQSKKHGVYKLYQEHMEETLHDISVVIENGSLFSNLGVKNFMEGDFFCWYVLEWNDEVEQAIQAIVDILGSYEPSTASLKPEVVRDLLKELYQGLMPNSVRHNLGEYYTPDWLAEITIKESGYSYGNKVLDPSCGSGTFLVLLINQVIEQMREVSPPGEIISHILNSIYGFDLNPLAVITARINYIIAIEPFLDAATAIEIPVYLSDAIFSPKQDKDYYYYHLDTEDGRVELCIPAIIMHKGLLTEMLNRIERLIHLSTDSGSNAITKEIAENDLTKWLSEYVDSNDIKLILDLFRTLHLLAMRNWDGIWCRIIKNHFASAVLKDFDVIVGNPPWLKWSSLPPAYRETIKEFCIQYGLFSSDSFYGGIESDVSTMVLYSAAEKWLRHGGRLSMLITRSVFKTESSEGFRMFRLPDNEQTYFKVINVHDFTKTRPFDDAKNKPTLLTLEKQNEATIYPLPWFEWNMQNTAKISSRDPLEVVENKTSTNELCAFPINSLGSPWLTIPILDIEGCQVLIKSEFDEKYYRARKGICTDKNGVYYGAVVRTQANNVIFENNPGFGRDKSIKKSSISIEDDLIYPIARGREISCFKWIFGGTYGILPQNSMHGYSEEKMLSEYPMALSYFASHKQSLLKRSSLKRYLPNDPFYSCCNVGTYTFSPYKVCWAEISGGFGTCIITEHCGKPVVPDHKIYFIPLEEEDEAKYLCTYLNATIIETLVRGYTETTQIGTHITDYVSIPRFAVKNKDHQALAQIYDRVIMGKTNISEARHEASVSVLKILNTTHH